MPRQFKKKPRGRDINGWLIVDKPSGIGSTDVVNKVKRAFDAQKAGHGGTLDPLATGLLPIAFGAATKTVPYVMDGTKVYHFTLRFGEARDSDDADGAVTETSEARPTDEAIRAALPALTGDIMQIPPIYSAIKINGERAYDLARDGQEVVLEARPARVDRFELIARPDATPGAVFAQMSYVLAFAESWNRLPILTERLAQARDVTRRLEHPKVAEGDAAGDGTGGGTTRRRPGAPPG